MCAHVSCVRGKNIDTEHNPKQRSLLRSLLCLLQCQLLLSEVGSLDPYQRKGCWTAVSTRVYCTFFKKKTKFICSRSLDACNAQAFQFLIHWQETLQLYIYHLNHCLFVLHLLFNRILCIVVPALLAASSKACIPSAATKSTILVFSQPKQHDQLGVLHLVQSSAWRPLPMALAVPPLAAAYPSLPRYSSTAKALSTTLLNQACLPSTRPPHSVSLELQRWVNMTTPAPEIPLALSLKNKWLSLKEAYAHLHFQVACLH